MHCPQKIEYAAASVEEAYSVDGNAQKLASL